MREGWKYKTFGEVGTFLRGKNIQKADFVEHGLPCIHYGQIHTKFGVSVDKHLSEIPEEVYNKSIIASPGDVVIAITSEDLEGSCKSTAWLGDYDVAVSSHAAVYKHNLNPKFIVYYLRSNSFYIEKEKYARGFKVMEIKPTDIARIPIPVPSKEIQSRVVSELDKINELIQLKKEQLSDYDKLAQSLFYDMFGDPKVNDKSWEMKRITDLCIDICAGGDASKHEIKKQKDDVFSFPVYSNGIDKNGLYGYSNHATINQPAITLAARGTIGAAFIRTEPYIPIIRLVSIIPDFSKISLTYLYYILKQTEWDRTGGTIPQLPVPKVKQLILPLPPLSLQQLFAQRIELIEQQKVEIQSTIADLETLLASRMQYWFD